MLDIKTNAIIDPILVFAFCFGIGSLFGSLYTGLYCIAGLLTISLLIFINFLRKGVKAVDALIMSLSWFIPFIIIIMVVAPTTLWMKINEWKAK